MYDLIFHPDYIHEKITFVGQEITILWKYIKNIKHVYVLVT